MSLILLDIALYVALFVVIYKMVSRLNEAFPSGSGLGWLWIGPQVGLLMIIFGAWAGIPMVAYAGISVSIFFYLLGELLERILNPWKGVYRKE